MVIQICASYETPLRIEDGLVGYKQLTKENDFDNDRILLIVGDTRCFPYRRLFSYRSARKIMNVRVEKVKSSRHAAHVSNSQSSSLVSTNQQSASNCQSAFVFRPGVTHCVHPSPCRQHHQDKHQESRTVAVTLYLRLTLDQSLCVCVCVLTCEF